MNDEMKKILSKYMLSCVVVTCLLCLCAGAVTAKQRSDYNTYFTTYAVLSVKTATEGISVSIDDRSYTFDKSRFKELAQYRKYLYFTPFSCTVFFFESIFEFFSSFKG